MEWADEAIVLSVRPHGENAAILEALTESHGRHLGLVHGGATSKWRAILQPGNRLRVRWRARLLEHLGVYGAELVSARAGDMFEQRAALSGLNALAAVAAAVLPEREPHRSAYLAADALLDAMTTHGFAEWAPLYVRWEMGLLNELGFGLDLARCAATGVEDDLVFVSPRTGRAVSAAAGVPYRDKLLALPAFLRARGEDAAQPADIMAGLELTAHFLEGWVLAPHGRTVPEVRMRFAVQAARWCSESA